MNFLAIDSASSILSIAVSKGDEVFYKEVSSEDVRLSESAMVVINNIMKNADLKPCDLDGVLCMKGPGSFTGLRIGYSIAKGLALSLNVPFAVVPTIKDITKDGGNYFYYLNGELEKRGFARELLEIGTKMDFSDNKALFSGPEY